MFNVHAANVHIFKFFFSSLLLLLRYRQKCVVLFHFFICCYCIFSNVKRKMYHSHSEIEHNLFSFRYDFFCQRFKCGLWIYPISQNNCITTLILYIILYCRNAKVQKCAQSSQKYETNIFPRTKKIHLWNIRQIADIQFSSVISCEREFYGVVVLFLSGKSQTNKKTAARSNGLTKILHVLPRTKVHNILYLPLNKQRPSFFFRNSVIKVHFFLRQ